MSSLCSFQVSYVCGRWFGSEYLRHFSPSGWIRLLNLLQRLFKLDFIRLFLFVSTVADTSASITTLFHENLRKRPHFITIRITNRFDFLYYVFISFFSSFPYMFRAFMIPSSGVFQAVVFMLPFGSCSALLIVCVRQRTGLWW